MTLSHLVGEVGAPWPTRHRLRGGISVAHSPIWLKSPSHERWELGDPFRGLVQFTVSREMGSRRPTLRRRRDGMLATHVPRVRITQVDDLSDGDTENGPQSGQSIVQSARPRLNCSSSCWLPLQVGFSTVCREPQSSCSGHGVRARRRQELPSGLFYSRPGADCSPREPPPPPPPPLLLPRRRPQTAAPRVCNF